MLHACNTYLPVCYTHSLELSVGAFRSAVISITELPSERFKSPPRLAYLNRVRPLAVHCQWEDETARERTDHPPSCVETKKMLASSFLLLLVPTLPLQIAT